MKETVRSLMDRVKNVWKEYDDGNVSAWELSRELEQEDAIPISVPKGTCLARIGFDKIFHHSFIRIVYDESQYKWAVIKMTFNEFGWEMHVSSQGGESDVESACYEISYEVIA